MADLNALVIFARVVEARGITEAARRLGMPTSTVSRRLADLEADLGVRLLERSTRSLRLTAAGAEVLEQARRGLDLGAAVDRIAADHREHVAGLLRLSTPPSISDSLVVPLVGQFQAAHPGLRVQVVVTERFVDPITDAIDLVLRVGGPREPGLAYRPLLRYRHRLVASPAYLVDRPGPRDPADLAKHRLLAFAQRKPMVRWLFVDAGGSTSQSHEFDPWLAMNDYHGLATALLTGMGIGDLPPIVRPDLVRDGRLVEVMPDWRFRTVDLCAVHLDGPFVARPVAAFRDFAAEAAPTLFPDLPA